MKSNSGEKELGRAKIRKNLFFVAVLCCFFSIYIYELLTPMLMDDMSYLSEVKQAGSVFDLISQEKTQYLGWTGRSVAHGMMRLLMYIDLHIFSGGRTIFNIVAAFAFTALSLLIYKNIQKQQKYDIHTYVFIVMLLWVFGVNFAQTVLWETGACNYLLTTTIILGFMTVYRNGVEKAIRLDKAQEIKGRLNAIGMFLFGILAGWCNENTSGACLLFVILLLVLFVRTGRKPRVWMITGVLGNVLGLFIMVLAPGNMQRAANREELHSGLLGFAARFLNITLAVREEFFILLCVLIVIVTLLKLQGKRWAELFDVMVFAFLFLAACYSLVMTVTPQNRALFGAGIFLILAIVQGYQDVREEARWVQLSKKAVIYCMLLYMFFTYLDSGASLARIYREEQERYNYLEEYAQTGAEDVEVPMLRPEFKTKYSAAYDCDVTEDWTYWTNVMMANYYGFRTLLGVERDGWKAY
ncbi:MAG: DUF6056 family protein [Butyrivibrio sp.]|nr:DUF6056 family protein [Butyrivibrio sp.]